MTYGIEFTIRDWVDLDILYRALQCYDNEYGLDDRGEKVQEAINKEMANHDRATNAPTIRSMEQRLETLHGMMLNVAARHTKGIDAVDAVVRSLDERLRVIEARIVKVEERDAH